MRAAASNLFGQPEVLESRPNVFGELMKVLISPSEDVQEAMYSVLKSGIDPDISLHMRMLMNRWYYYLTNVISCSLLLQLAIRIDSTMSSSNKFHLIDRNHGCASFCNPFLSLSNVHLYFRSVRGLQAALQCIRKAMLNLSRVQKPRLVLVSDTPNFVKSIMPILGEFAEVIALIVPFYFVK